MCCTKYDTVGIIWLMNEIACKTKSKSQFDPPRLLASEYSAVQKLASYSLLVVNAKMLAVCIIVCLLCVF